MRHVINQVRTHGIELAFSDLLTTVFGAQGPIVIHEILPAGWEVKEVEVITETDLNGAGTRTLSIGVPGAATAIVNALDVDAAGRKTVTTVPYLSTAPVAIIATLTTGTANPTAGTLLVVLHLVQVRMEN